jgi:hypothetical protein
MTRRTRHVTTCPDCGGILQSITPEALTSADVERDPHVAAQPAPRQCLICGYEEAPGPELVAAL